MDFEISNTEIQKALLEHLRDYGSDITKETTAKKSQRRRKRKRKKEEESNQIDKANERLPEEKNDKIEAVETIVKITDRGTTRPSPTVIVFEEPGKSRKKDQYEDVPGRGPQPKRNKLNINSNKEPNLKELAREVTELGVTGFSREERRKFEQQKVQALGGKAPKQKPVPYPLAIEAAKKKKEEEFEQWKMNKAMGIITKKKYVKEKERLPRDCGRWVDRTRYLDAAVGKYKRGVQRLSKADIKKIKNSGKRQWKQ